MIDPLRTDSSPSASGTAPAALRAKLVGQALDKIHALHDAQGITRDSLAATARVLEGLAQHADLFSLADFPPPASGEGSCRYALHADEDQSYALYLNVQHPGKNSVPHNHKTWAVITAVQGQEFNRIYRRTDDGRTPGRATLELAQEITVQVGISVAYMGDDIHSIHVQGQQPTLHFHLYGRALETLTERVAFDLQTGEIKPYNSSFWKPNASA